MLTPYAGCAWGCPCSLRATHLERILRSHEPIEAFEGRRCSFVGEHLIVRRLAFATIEDANLEVDRALTQGSRVWYNGR